MKLSLKKQNEIKVWEYFIPSNCDWAEKTNEDIEIFFEWSEQGKHRDVMAIPTYKLEGRTYAHALYWGKKWAGIHCHELWGKDRFSDGWIGFNDLFDDMPDEVISFIKKEMNI